MDTTLSLTDAVTQLFNGALDPYEISIVFVGLCALAAICLLVIALLMAGTFALLSGVRAAIDHSDAKHQNEEDAIDPSTDAAGQFDESAAVISSAASEALSDQPRDAVA